MAEEKKILTELCDGVLIVTINREQRRNSIDTGTAEMMEEILNKAEKDDAVRAVVLTGVGEKCFCAGEDLKAFAESGGCFTETEHGFAGITERFSAKPYIAAMNGTAVGGGLEIALACDMVVTADHAWFGLTECKVGLVASSGGLVRLPKLIPPKIASEMVLTGEFIDAKRAYDLGLVNYVLPKEKVLGKAIELAKAAAANAPISIRVSKQIMHMSPHMSEEDGMRMSRYMAGKFVEGTEDAQEGSAAFAEKRKPIWKNK